MTTSTRVRIQAQPMVDRLELRDGLEATRLEFHRLLESVSDTQWRHKSPTSAWTVAEVFVHLTWALEYLPEEVARARHGQGMFNLPKRLMDPLSYWYMRWLARKATRYVIAQRYDAAMAAAMRALDAVEDSDWTLGAQFYGEGWYTVADLFRVPAQHLAEHHLSYSKF